MRKIILLLFITALSWADSPFRCEYEVTSPFGATTGYGGMRRNNVHQGVDLIPVEWDWIIFPIFPGVVADIGIDPIYGKFIVIDHGNGLFSLYAHGETIYDRALPGMKVEVDAPIMRMGTSGYSDGPHLHLEVFRIVDNEKVCEDPLQWIGGSN